ncbi:MAG: hypothetical protein IT384_24370 [Deltaproteobacteria bacterium]|nr:hypothetical protein [Deltaproteobacteria bacterium]
MALVTIVSTASFVGCNPAVDCGPGTELAPDGTNCIASCAQGTQRGADGACIAVIGDPCKETQCTVGPQQQQSVASLRGVGVLENGQLVCQCTPATCQPGYRLEGSSCIQEITCPASYRQEGALCIPCDDCTCDAAPDSPACIPVRCEDYPELRALNGEGRTVCTEDPAPPAESCVTGCHNGIEDPHPWFGGPDLTCTGCHGGNATATTRETAHTPIPANWQEGSPQWGRPNLRYYWNYNTLFGVENSLGGLEWLRFRNPGDLRVADQSCGKAAGCHLNRVENNRRGVMATEVGLSGVAMMRDAAPRSVLRGQGGKYKWDTTEGAILGWGEMTARVYEPTVMGSIQKLNSFRYSNREQNGAYNQIDLLKEIYDKQCGDCHLGNAGANNRYADFRSSGCTACHMPYSLDGRSRSQDQQIKKDEPTYPAAWAQIANFNANDLVNANGAFLGPERSHPTYHRLTRQIVSQRCGSCHVGSNRTDWQYRGYRFDPNRDAVTALNNARLNANQVTFSDEIDNNADPFARYHGQAQNQVLKYEDWNADGLDDSPADIHYLAGLECMDCHTTGEMHNEIKLVKVEKVTDWADKSQVLDMSGALFSHMDQATEVECVHCHGNLEYRARGYTADNRNPIKNLIVCPESGEVIPDYTPPAECTTAVPGQQALGRGRWLRSKFTGRYHYVPQVKDTVQQYATGGGPVRPGSQQQIYTLNASIFHGRVDQDVGNGVGPCANGNPNSCFKDQANNALPIRQGFSHLGQPASSAVDQMAGGLECYACHATWQYACFGCHLTLRDFNGQVLRDFSRSTGEYTIGVIAQADFTYIDPLAIQFGINSEGKISQFEPETKQRVRHVDAAGNDYFGTQVIVNNDANIQYNSYRDRAGYGTRQYATEQVGLPPNADGQDFEQDARMDNNQGQGFNQMMPHAVQRSHPRMDCNICHIDTNAANANWVQAVFGVNPNGFANVSAYLVALDGLNITRNNTGDNVAVNAAAGFRFDANIDPNGYSVDMQSDWVVLADGFPLAYNNHPIKLGTVGITTDPFYDRQYPRLARTAGPLNQTLLNAILNEIKVNNEGVQFRGTR